MVGDRIGHVHPRHRMEDEKCIPDLDRRLGCPLSAVCCEEQGAVEAITVRVYMDPAVVFDYQGISDEALRTGIVSVGCNRDQGERAGSGVAALHEGGEAMSCVWRG